MLGAPGRDRVLDRPLLQMVEDLIAGDPPLSRDRQCPCHFLHIEVTDPVEADLAVAHEPLERRERPLERVRARPVQEVEIEPVGPETAEARLAGAEHALERRVGRQDLRSQEYLVAPAGDRFSDELLDDAGSVHLRRVDVGHPLVQPRAQCDHDARTLVALQVPGPLTDDRHGDPGPAEWAALHEKRDPDGLARRRRRPAGAAGAIGVRWCLGPRRVTQRRRSGFALRGHHLTDHRRGIRHWITSFRAAGEPSGPEHPPPGGGRRLPSPDPDHRRVAGHGTCVCPDRESLVECYRRRLALSIRGSGPAPLAAPPRATR